MNVMKDREINLDRIVLMFIVASIGKLIDRAFMVRCYTSDTFISKRSKLLRKQILQLHQTQTDPPKQQETRDRRNWIRDSFSEIRSGVKLDGNPIDRLANQLTALKGREWVDPIIRDRCLRGAVELAAVSLSRLNGANQEPSLVRQLLVMTLSRRFIEWKSCSGIVHTLLEDYTKQNHSIDQILSLAKQLYQPNDRSQILNPSSKTMILLLNLSRRPANSEVFFSTWNAIVKVALLRQSKKDLPIEVSSAFLMGCLYFDGDQDVLHSFQRESHSTSAILEFTKVTQNGVEGPLLVKNDLIQLVKKAKNPDSVMFLLDSRLGTRRYNKRRKKDEFLTSKVLRTPLEILWDGNPSRGPRRLGAPLTRTTMLKLAQFNAFQLLMEIFSSNVSPMTLNTLVQIAEEKQSYRLAASVLRIIKDRQIGLSQGSYRRILRCMTKTRTLVNHSLKDVLCFVDYYMDTTSITNLTIIFQAMCHACSNFEDVNVVLGTLKRMMDPHFDPEGGLSDQYPFPTSRHYRTNLTPIVMKQANNFRSHESWKLQVLVVVGKGASFLRCPIPEKLHFVNKWLQLIIDWKRDSVDEMWTQQLQDRLFGILISIWVHSSDPVEDLRQGFLYDLMKLGYCAGLMPGIKTKRTMLAIKLHMPNPPFKYFRHDVFPHTPLLYQITRGNYDLTTSNPISISHKMCDAVVEHHMKELVEIGFLKRENV